MTPEQRSHPHLELGREQPVTGRSPRFVRDRRGVVAPSGLAVTLDALSRELDVLFVVPTGNYEGDEDGPANWREDYPEYLTGQSARLLDPAPALNALTVGSLARHERHERWPEDPGYRPVARADQPSPFTRCGPSVNGAVKPDLVDYGGNLLVESRAGDHLSRRTPGAGELSVSNEFGAGRPFAEDSGTSFAAPGASERLAIARLAPTPPADPPAGSGCRCRDISGASRWWPGDAATVARNRARHEVPRIISWPALSGPRCSLPLTRQRTPAPPLPDWYARSGATAAPRPPLRPHPPRGSTAPPRRRARPVPPCPRPTPPARRNR